jgi:hypothetical protein
MTKRFEIQGVTDERDTCDCCGKSNLKRTVALADADAGGEVVFFGTTCAARAMKIPAADVRKGARAAQRTKDRAAQMERVNAQTREFAKWVAFLRTATGGAKRSDGTDDVSTMIRQMGGFAKARAAFKE